MILYLVIGLVLTSHEGVVLVVIVLLAKLVVLFNFIARWAGSYVAN